MQCELIERGEDDLPIGTPLKKQSVGKRERERERELPNLGIGENLNTSFHDSDRIRVESGSRSFSFDFFFFFLADEETVNEKDLSRKKKNEKDDTK